jgi:nucleoid-associated protein YgaU
MPVSDMPVSDMPVSNLWSVDREASPFPPATTGPGKVEPFADAVANEPSGRLPGGSGLKPTRQSGGDFDAANYRRLGDPPPARHPNPETSPWPSLPTLRQDSVAGPAALADKPTAVALPPAEFNSDGAPGSDSIEIRDAPVNMANRLETNLIDSDNSVQRASAESSVRATSIISQDGDSFWLIAQRVYDDGRYFNALYEFNRQQVPAFNGIPVGTRIATPAVAQLRQRWPRLCPDEPKVANQGDALSGDSGSYLTQGGESLFEIARDELGQASRYLEILDLNRDRLPEATNHQTELPAELIILLPPR